MRSLLDYLPKFVQEYQEIKAIMNAENPEFVLLENQAQLQIQNQFVISADENGISRFEKMLGINPKSTYSLEERRFAVLLKINELPPFTMEVLKMQLDEVCGVGGYTIELFSNEYRLKIKINLTNKNNFDTVKEMIDRIIPANMIFDVELLYNQHHLLKQFKHQQLQPYTHEKLRNEVLV